MDNTTVKQGIITAAAGMLYALLWIILTVMILIHIDATIWMWIVFVATVPLRIVTEIATKKVLAKIREEP